MTETDLVRAIKAYRLEHRCGLQEAIDAVRGPRAPAPDTMTEKTSTLGIVEQMIASVFRRQPDMSGDNRRRLMPHEYRTVQDVAAEIVEFFGQEGSASVTGSSGYRSVQAEPPPPPTDGGVK